MSFSSTTNEMNYTGNGSVDTYAYSFYVLADTDLVVTVRDADDVETTLTLTTHYTVTGAGTASGGNVVLVGTPAFAWIDADGDLESGFKLNIRRKRPLTQITDIRNQGEFLPEIHEDAFDHAVMIDQQQQFELDRSLKLPNTVRPADFAMSLPPDIAGASSKAPLTNAAGDGWADAADWPSATAISGASASAAAAAASASASSTSATLASDWATKIDGQVATTDYSAKAWAIGGTGVTDTASRGAAKEWATETASTVDGTDYSAKEWAKGTQTRGAASGGSAKDWATYTGGTVDDTEYSAKHYAGLAGADLAAHEADTTNIHGIADTAALLTETNTKTVTNKTFTDPVINAVVLDDQASTPSSPSAGFYKLYAKSNGKVYKLNSSGTEQEVGSGGAGGKNYAQDLFAGDSVTGITGTTGLTATVNASSPLRAGGNIRLSKDAANRQNGYWTIPLDEIDIVDLDGNKPLTIQFRVRTSAAFASSDVRIRIYDNDAAAYVNVSGLMDSSGYLLAAPDSTLFTANFYTTEGNSDLEIRVFVDTVNASAYDIDLVDLSVGPDQVVPGAIQTDWQSYTPTFTGFGTVSGVNISWRRNGPNLEVEGVFTAGTVTAVEGRLSFPSPVPAAASTLPTLSVAGEAIRTATGAFAVYVLREPSVSYFTFGLQSSGTTALSKATVSGGLIGNGEGITIKASVPIVNWLASAALSTTETMLSTVKARYTTNASQSIATGGTPTIVDFEDRDFDTHTSVTTGGSWKFTAPKNGYYNVAATVTLVAGAGWNANESMGAFVYKNGVQYSSFGLQVAEAVNTVNYSSSGATVVYLNKSDYIDVRVYQTTGASVNIEVNPYTHVSVVELPDFSIFSVYGQTEYQESTSSSATNWPFSANNWGDLTSLTLTPGEYDLTGVLLSYNNGTVTAGNMDLGISTTSGNSATGLTVGSNRVGVSHNTTNGQIYQNIIPNYRVVVTSSTTYYLKALYNTTVTSIQYLGYRLSARRVK
jgi:hypothetical protein